MNRKNYSKLDDLLHEIICHVRSVGVGRCIVSCDDDPVALQVGFQVTSLGEDPLSYRINLTSMKEELNHFPSLATVEGRQILAESLSRGENRRIGLTNHKLS